LSDRGGVNSTRVTMARPQAWRRWSKPPVVLATSRSWNRTYVCQVGNRVWPDL
jgi:hypothetical protein